MMRKCLKNVIKSIIGNLLWIYSALSTIVYQYYGIYLFFFLTNLLSVESLQKEN